MKRLVIAFAALLVAAPSALAADHDATLSSAATTFDWEGAPHISRGAPLYDEAARTAIPCDSGPARECETVLFNLVEAGRLTATVEGLEGTVGTTDADAYLYESDAAGTQGELVASGAANGPDSVGVRAASSGYYLLVVDYYHSYNSGYTGKAKFTPAAPPTPAPVVTPPGVEPPAAPAPAKPAKKKKASCKAKAKKVKNKKKRKKALKRCKRKSKR